MFLGIFWSYYKTCWGTFLRRTTLNFPISHGSRVQFPHARFQIIPPGQNNYFSSDRLSGSTHLLAKIVTFYSVLLVLHLSLPAFHFKGKKNEYTPQRGWRPLANRYRSRSHRIYMEKSKARNGAPYAEVWMGKSRQNIIRRYNTYGVVNILTFKEKYPYGASYGVRTYKFLCMLMRDTDELHFIETPR